MTVFELIAQLQMVENKDAVVVIDNMEVNYVVCDKTQDEEGFKVQYVWLYD